MGIAVAVLALVGVVAGMTVAPAAFADHPTGEVSNLAGTSMPGCEETEQCFSPSTITIDAGGEVTWSNDDTVVHTITGGSLTDIGPDGTFDSGLLDPGSTFSRWFGEAGEYPYFCMLHPWMAGTVVVQGTTHGHGPELPEARLTLDKVTERVSEGDSVVVSGVLAAAGGNGAPIASETIRVMEGSSGEVLVSLVTGDDGRFEWVMTDPLRGGQSIYAAYEGGSHGQAESDRYDVQVDALEIPGEPSESYIAFDPVPATIHAGEPVTFTGSLSSGDSALPSKLVWIWEGEDQSRILGYSVTDAQGGFAVQWTGAGLPEADLEVYAAFRGDSWYAESQSSAQTSAFAYRATAGVTISEGAAASRSCAQANTCYDPHTVTIGIEGEVTWSNGDQTAHTVTSGTQMGGSPLFESGDISAGETFAHTFQEAGEYPYRCTIHPWMAGIVSVQEPADDAGP